MMKVCKAEQTLRELKVGSPAYWHAVIDILDMFLLLGLSLLLECDCGVPV